METIEAIEKRRSIRKFLDKEIEQEIIENIIDAGIKAPSGKNIQPWKYVVVTKESKAAMLQIMKNGIEKNDGGVMKQYRELIISSKHTLKIMAEAPVTIFIINAENEVSFNLTMEEKMREIVNIQSIGASIQNMILAALDYGIGSLWICDVYMAYRELCEWLKTDKQLIAAVSFGYPDEKPFPRPRKKIEEVVEWR